MARNRKIGAAAQQTPVVDAVQQNPLAAMAAALATPAASSAAPQQPQTVALRGGLAIASVVLTGKPYRVAAPHNVAWFATISKLAAASGGTASVQAIVAAGVPAPFVGYVVRRGYLAPAPATA